MKRILFVQTGDYREAYLRFQQGGPETFRDQRRSVDFVAALAPEARVFTLALGPQSYPDTELAPNLLAAGQPWATLSRSDIAALFDREAPTHVMLRTPHLDILRQARQRGVHILPSFADIFGYGGPRTLLRNFLFRRELLRCNAPCIANHSLNASRSLVEVLRLPARKVIPWDWSKIPVTEPAKTGPANPDRPCAFFAGGLTEDKGVGDCLEAIAALKTQGVRLDMTFAGGGDLDLWQQRTQALDIADRITFLGMIPNTEVRVQMNRHDLVIVPSRHSYPEGLPNTIYEALASRSVLLISDHPAFAGRLREDEEVLSFKAADPGALARCIRKALDTPGLYKTLSENSPAAHDTLYAGMEWSSLVHHFLADPENTGGWVDQYCLERLADAQV